MTGSSGSWRRLALKSALAVRGIFDLGPTTSLAIATNSLRTERQRHLDGRRRGASGQVRTPGRLCSVESIGHGVRCAFEEAELEVVFLTDDLVRVHWGPGPRPLPWALNGPIGLGDVDRPSAVTVTADLDTGCLVRTPSLEIEIDPQGEVRYRRDGRLLRHELAPLRRGPTRTARFWLRPDERISGLGEQAARVDLRGGVHRLWNRDPGGAYGPGEDPLYCAIPVLVGLHPDGDVLAFYENTFEAVVGLGGHAPGAGGSAAKAELTFAGGTLRHYLAFGPPARLLERYSALTGRPPMPPRWALGYHQCRWGYRSEADVREVTEGFAADSIPLSAVYLDIDYMDGYRIFTVDGERFPDLSKLTGDLLEGGVRVVTIVDPAVKEDPDYPLYVEGCRDGRFVRRAEGDEEPFVGVVWPGRAVYPDFTDPAVRAWWGEQYRVLLDQGVAGIWHDMNEPTSIAMWGDQTLPRSVPHHAEGRGGEHRECHNAYGLLMDRVGWEALAEQRPERRPFVLSRAGWAGLARWAWNWTADIEASWEGLRQQVATAIGLGLSGVPYTGSDIGGFSGNPTPELFVRWLELSVLMPFCRTHSVTGAEPREPWRFPEPYRSAIARLIRFRYRLLPYLYTLAEETTRTGVPLVRPLCWDGDGPSSDDRRLWWVDDAYLLGHALLIAPATRQGSATRRLDLPAGRWFHWRTTESEEACRIVEGGTAVSLPVPLGHPPLLVRQGTVLPLDDGWTEAGPTLETSHGPRRLAFHCFPDARGDAAGAAYDDAGDGDGPGRRDRLELAAAEDAGALLTWRSEGAWPRPDLVDVVVHGARVVRAIADGQEAELLVGGSAASPATVIRSPAFERLTLEYG